jgi:superoxide dismutase, Cu-Zn family
MLRVFTRLLIVVGCGTLLLTSCSDLDNHSNRERPDNSNAPADGKVLKASAKVNPTQGNAVKALITFTAVDGGVTVVADAEGLTPGKHGFHVHEFGDCSAPDGSSAGAHFNPNKTKHGGPDSSERHVGDLGNLVADETGKAHYERTDKIISLRGPNSIIGKSIVIHSGEDDFKTQPSGNSGARVACGVIVEE